MSIKLNDMKTVVSVETVGKGNDNINWVSRKNHLTISSRKIFIRRKRYETKKLGEHLKLSYE